MNISFFAAMKHLADSERNGRMERVYAFTDEYGAFGWDIDNPSVSTHFIITAVIVKESNLSVFTQKANNLRKRHFQTGEIKSSRIGKDHNRRLRVLSDLQDIPFSFFSVCIDKKKCKENMSTRGLQYKKSFYKFMNNIVHREFRRAFEKITVVADEIGNSDYMQSFCEYVSTDPEVEAQVIVLQYLLFRFMNNDTRGYIYTYELKDQLANTELRNMKDQAFRMRIIGKLRDKGVIIASSQKGYKIPSKQAELYDFINHDAKIVIPMLARLKKCRDLVKLGTVNELDLLDHPEYRQLQAFFDSLPEETASQL